MYEYKVVFHIDEMNKWKLLLANVTNLINALEGNPYRIVVVANGEAVKYYDTTQDLGAGPAALEKLSAQGTRFTACKNALAANHMEKFDLIPLVEIVPAGVMELAKKHREGYAYIKP
ncbi:DsrE family protein [Alkalibacter rhizosphaerae]|uniref:DsrE family protein n=1 Tax=Alkalibacter rhizosphaerae TaxID=2815577 RepID=A0A974XIN5_9FIRM|nr:DsrE family protein [Alkalibacter rhizosphaerae]QSX09465.1 DsrE family protein [Alkalibacter rhizosphaerae]